MMLVTGATGKLGRHVMEGLLVKGPATELAVAVRNVAKAADYAARGVAVRHADYDQPHTLVAAFTGIDKVLLISGSEVGKRAAQHLAVIKAAQSAGVRFLAYTSMLRADTSGLALAREHKTTEDAIRGSGLAYVLLRNGWYIENHTEQLDAVLKHGVIAGAAGDGRFASAARQDYAAAAVTVLTEEGHENRVYELTGDSPFTLEELAAEVSKQAGKAIAYTNLSPEQYKNVLVGAGMPSPYTDILVDADVGASRGELDGASGDLRRLIGRPSTSLRDAIEAALKNGNAIR
jgi:NAD(P)H dehydrogenase (quinone)